MKTLFYAISKALATWGLALVVFAVVMWTLSPTIRNEDFSNPEETIKAFLLLWTFPSLIFAIFFYFQETQKEI